MLSNFSAPVCVAARTFVSVHMVNFHRRLDVEHASNIACIIFGGNIWPSRILQQQSNIMTKPSIYV